MWLGCGCGGGVANGGVWRMDSMVIEVLCRC